MTLSNNYQPTKVSANGIIVDFGFTWNGLNTSYIKVYLEDKTTGDQTLVESTEYTFTAFNESGGNVRFNTAPADTNYVIISREVSETQETPYKTSLGFNGEDVEASFDKLTGKVQELSETLDRTPTMPLGTETGAEFPVPVPGNLIQGNPEGTGWEDSGVSSQDLVDDAESARQSATAAAASETAAANSAVEASGYADDAEESATIAKESFKGDWADDYVDPISGLDGYAQGNTVVFGANQWWSKTDQNTSVPPLEYTTPSAEWEHYLRGAITNDEFVADVKEATFLGDGVTTDFDLTADNPTLRPTSKNQILAVFIDTDPVAEEDYSISINSANGHSIIMFNTAPDAPVDPNGTFNIIVRGATPKIIPNFEEVFAIAKPIDNNLTYVDAKNVSWYGDCLADDDNTILSVSSGSPVTGTLPTTTTSVMYYMFVGLDASSTVVAEFTTDITGATGLSTIVGKKRRVFNVKTDLAGDIISFLFNKENDFVKFTSTNQITTTGSSQTFDVIVPNSSDIQVQCQTSFPVSASFNSVAFYDDDNRNGEYARVTTASTARNTENFTMRVSSLSKVYQSVNGTVNSTIFNIVGYYNYV